MIIRSLRLAALATLFVLIATASAAQAQTRITGGSKVSLADYNARWGSIVSVRTELTPAAQRRLGGLAGEISDGNGSARTSHICGGTLVTATIVVTAAHCVGLDPDFRTADSEFTVLANTRRLGSGSKRYGATVRVAEVRVHPRWMSGAIDQFSVDDEVGDLRWDVAVLRLATPVPGAVTSPLIGADEQALWGAGKGMPRGARVAGWGVTNPLFFGVDDDDADSTQALLREVELPLLSDASCERSDLAIGSSAAQFDRATMLCGYAPNTDRRPRRSNRLGACYGDSGGPLLVHDDAGEARLVGIVSWGPEAAGGCNRPSVFTRVDAMRPWIESVIAQGSASSPLRAASSLTSQVVNVNTLRVRWAGGSATPARQTLLRNVTWWQYLVNGLGVRLATSVTSAKQQSAMRRAHLLIPVGVGGPDSSELRVGDIEPVRPGVSRSVSFRVEVFDHEGGRSLGPTMRVAAPVDSRRPSVVARPIVRPAVVRGGGRVMQLRWKVARDNDCVDVHLLQLREAGHTRWRTRGGVSGMSCSAGFGSAGINSESGPLAAAGVEVADHEETVTQTPGRYTLFSTTPGRYAARIVAIDRAGNKSFGAAALVRVPERVRPPKPTDSCVRRGSRMVCTMSYPLQPGQ